MAKKDVGAKIVIDTKEAVNSIDKVTKGVQKANEETTNFKKTLSNLGDNITSAFKNTAIVGWISAIKTGLDVMIKATKAEADYVESLNLMQVAYDNDTKSADKLIHSMNELIGLDPSNLTKQLGTYRQFSSAMGIAGKQANMLSENLLKLQTDVSSLYNIDFATAGKKLQSAIAGQTRPIRELGADITEASLQQELYNRGINKSVDELNRASKSVLIYLTLERQLSNANGDASKTINSLANQVRIFKEQIAIAGRQVGAVFIPILRSILPYANAILMVFNEIMNMLLALLGVDASSMAREFGIGTSSVIDLDDSVNDLSNSLGGATKKAKELKSSLRGFDKLNNITTPTETTGGGGISGGIGGALSGVDSALLDALKEYDLHLDSISNKAVQIKDSIMKWLGFAKDTNGEWEFSKVTLGTILGILAGGAGIYSIGAKIFEIGGKIGTHIADFAKKIPILKGNLADMSKLEIFGAVSGLAIALVGIIKSVVSIVDLIKDPSWSNFNDVLNGIFTILTGGGITLLSMLQGTDKMYGLIILVVGALGLLATSLFDTRTDVEKLRDAQEKLNQAQEKYIQASKKGLDAYNRFEDAEKNLTKTAKAHGKTREYVISEGERLYKLLGETDTTISDLSDTEREYYKAYTEYIESDKALKKANQEIIDTYKEEQVETINTNKVLANQSKTVDEASERYSNLATSIQNAYNNNTITLSKYSIEMGKIYNKLDDESKKTFMDSIPSHLQSSVKEWAKIQNAMGATDNLLGELDKKSWTVKVDNKSANNALNELQTKFNTLKKLVTSPVKVALNTALVAQGVQLKANGGFLNSGDMFIANENGVPEMIGQIGNQPAVANNDQIVEAISIGVAKAMASATPRQTVIKAEGDTSGLLNFINFEQEKRNRQYGL